MHRHNIVPYEKPYCIACQTKTSLARPEMDVLSNALYSSYGFTYLFVLFYCIYRSNCVLVFIFVKVTVQYTVISEVNSNFK